MEASSGVAVDRYQVVTGKIMGYTTWSVLDTKTDRFVVGANTAKIAAERCLKLNADDRKQQECDVKP